MGFEHAKTYAVTNGNADISSDYVCDDGYLLGAWASNQRNKYKSGKLSNERVKRLESIGFLWSAHTDKWNCGYIHANEYRRSGGNLPIPQTYVTRDGYPLGEWLRNQERRYRNGMLEDDRVRRLAEIGVTFSAH